MKAKLKQKKTKFTAEIPRVFVEPSRFPLVEFFEGGRSLLDSHNELFDVGETPIEQCLKTQCNKKLTNWWGQATWI